MDLILRILSVLFALTALFLVIISVIFTFSEDDPSIFGNNIYIVKTDAFGIVNKGDAILASEVPYEEIHAGNIVIYKNSENQSGIAEVHSSEQIDGVYTFAALSERGLEIKVSQGQIIGKAMQTSGFLGGLINFAKSPSGVLIIAVLPCLSVLIYEATKFILAHFKKEHDVNPIKKQDEVPTFIPRPKVNVHNKNVPANGKKIDAVINTYSKTALNNTGENDFDYLTEKKRENGSGYPLFTSPANKMEALNRSVSGKQNYNTQKIKPEKTYPITQKRLNEVIAEMNTKRNPAAISNISANISDNISTNVSANVSNAKNVPNTEINTATTELESKDIKRTAVKNTVAETVRRYTPKKAPPENFSTSTLPRLDKLLNDDGESDSDNIKFDIGDILSSLERKG